MHKKIRIIIIRIQIYTTLCELKYVIYQITQKDC